MREKRRFRVTDVYGRNFVEIGREAALDPAVIARCWSKYTRRPNG
jgi:hypothetical protein